MLRKRQALSFSIVFLGCLIVANAAQRPDFSGVWKLDLKASGMPESAAPQNLTIKQSATAMIVDFNVKEQGQTLVITYNLDGTETAGKTIKGEPLKYRAKWDGNKLVATIQEPVRSDGRSSETVQTYELNGDRLIFETTRLGKTFRQIFTK